MVTTMRLIDADALIAKAYIMQEPNGFIHSVVTERQIVKCPTIEAEPVKHGRWVDVGYKIRCSLCDRGVFLGTTDPVAHNYEKENFNYCPNCGAKMQGGKNND